VCAIHTDPEGASLGEWGSGAVGQWGVDCGKWWAALRTTVGDLWARGGTQALLPGKAQLSVPCLAPDQCEERNKG
jgi:hypothetical protein